MSKIGELQALVESLFGAIFNDQLTEEQKEKIASAVAHFSVELYVKDSKAGSRGLTSALYFSDELRAREMIGDAKEGFSLMLCCIGGMRLRLNYRKSTSKLFELVFTDDHSVNLANVIRMKIFTFKD